MLGTCKVVGEIDMATASPLRADLFATIDNSEAPFVEVDCSGVTFMDAAGYHALVAANAYASRHGRTLVIRNVPPVCARLLSLCDHEHELHLEHYRERQHA
jgi:anti-anti-sigma factor